MSLVSGQFNSFPLYADSSFLPIKSMVNAARVRRLIPVDTRIFLARLRRNYAGGSCVLTDVAETLGDIPRSDPRAASVRFNGVWVPSCRLPSDPHSRADRVQTALNGY